MFHQRKMTQSEKKINVVKIPVITEDMDVKDVEQKLRQTVINIQVIHFDEYSAGVQFNTIQ